ncbi:MAG TPA: hypothetical protein VK615_05435 [Candidatus Binatia bacterium]|nr:hypothetical protein [Candidatus Binatia bacterium]
MKLVALMVGIVVAAAAGAAEPSYKSDVSKWQEVVQPSTNDQGSFWVWNYAANRSRFEWRVFQVDGRVHAQLTGEGFEKPKIQPKFAAKAGRFRKATAFAEVDDGWLVGFNQGEFGAALYWFSSNGKENCKISNHQVVDFLNLSNGVHAIEGLAHLGISRGSLIRIARTSGRWHAISVVKLPFAPYAVSVRKDESLLITLSDSLVAVGPDHKVDTLLGDARWGDFYPGSSILDLDEQKLYIGMRQFVGEFNLTSKALRFLIPGQEFLEKLPKENEDRIRKQYGGEK